MADATCDIVRFVRKKMSKSFKNLQISSLHLEDFGVH